MFRNGYLTIGKFRGSPIRVHWSAPVAAVAFGHFRFVPGFWLGFFLLVLLHELGHAVVVRTVHARVTSVEVNGLGGLCWWQGDVSPVARAAIAWGGVWAQMACWVVATLAIAVHAPEDAFTADLAWAFTSANVWMMCLNLIPIPPLDGSQAWKLFPLLAERRRVRAYKTAANAHAKADAISRKALRDLDAREGSDAPPEVARLVDDILARAKDPGER
jgi:stage IV sporulation protein FB